MTILYEIFSWESLRLLFNNFSAQIFLSNQNESWTEELEVVELFIQNLWSVWDEDAQSSEPRPLQKPQSTSRKNKSFLGRRNQTVGSIDNTDKRRTEDKRQVMSLRLKFYQNQPKKIQRQKDLQSNKWSCRRLRMKCS